MLFKRLCVLISLGAMLSVQYSYALDSTNKVVSSVNANAHNKSSIAANEKSHKSNLSKNKSKLGDDQSSASSDSAASKFGTNSSAVSVDPRTGDLKIDLKAIGVSFSAQGYISGVQRGYHILGMPYGLSFGTGYISSSSSAVGDTYKMSYHGADYTLDASSSVKDISGQIVYPNLRYAQNPNVILKYDERYVAGSSQLNHEHIDNFGLSYYPASGDSSGAIDGKVVPFNQVFYELDSNYSTGNSTSKTYFNYDGLLLSSRDTYLGNHVDLSYETIDKQDVSKDVRNERLVGIDSYAHTYMEEGKYVDKGFDLKTRIKYVSAKDAADGMNQIDVVLSDGQAEKIYVNEDPNGHLDADYRMIGVEDHMGNLYGFNYAYGNSQMEDVEVLHYRHGVKASDVLLSGYDNSDEHLEGYSKYNFINSNGVPQVSSSDSYSYINKLGDSDSSALIESGMDAHVDYSYNGDYYDRNSLNGQDSLYEGAYNPNAYYTVITSSRDKKEVHYNNYGMMTQQKSYMYSTQKGWVLSSEETDSYLMDMQDVDGSYNKYYAPNSYKILPAYYSHPLEVIKKVYPIYDTGSSIVSSKEEHRYNDQGNEILKEDYYKDGTMSDYVKMDGEYTVYDSRYGLVISQTKEDFNTNIKSRIENIISLDGHKILGTLTSKDNGDKGQVDDFSPWTEKYYAYDRYGEETDELTKWSDCNAHVGICGIGKHIAKVYSYNTVRNFAGEQSNDVFVDTKESKSYLSGNSFDSSKPISAQVSLFGTVESYDDLDNGQTIYKVDTLGNKTSYHYDSNNILDKVTDAKGASISYGYNLDDMTSWKRDMHGVTIKQSMNALNQVLSTSSNALSVDGVGSGYQLLSKVEYKLADGFESNRGEEQLAGEYSYTNLGGTEGASSSDWQLVKKPYYDEYGKENEVEDSYGHMKSVKNQMNYALDGVSYTSGGLKKYLIKGSDDSTLLDVTTAQGAGELQKIPTANGDAYRSYEISKSYDLGNNQIGQTEKYGASKLESSQIKGKVVSYYEDGFNQRTLKSNRYDKDTKGSIRQTVVSYLDKDLNAYKQSNLLGGDENNPDISFDVYQKYPDDYEDKSLASKYAVDILGNKWIKYKELTKNNADSHIEDGSLNKQILDHRYTYGYGKIDGVFSDNNTYWIVSESYERDGTTYTQKDYYNVAGELIKHEDYNGNWFSYSYDKEGKSVASYYWDGYSWIKDSENKYDNLEQLVEQDIYISDNSGITKEARTYKYLASGLTKEITTTDYNGSNQLNSKSSSISYYFENRNKVVKDRGHYNALWDYNGYISTDGFGIITKAIYDDKGRAIGSYLYTNIDNYNAGSPQGRTETLYYDKDNPPVVSMPNNLQTIRAAARATLSEQGRLDSKNKKNTSNNIDWKDQALKHDGEVYESIVYGANDKVNSVDQYIYTDKGESYQINTYDNIDSAPRKLIQSVTNVYDGHTGHLTGQDYKSDLFPESNYSVSYSYDRLSLITHQTTTYADTNKVINDDYTYNSNNGLTKWVEDDPSTGIQTKLFSYNKNGQLLSLYDSKTNFTATNYSYDANGNITSYIASDGKNVSLTWDRYNHLTSYTHNNQTTYYSYGLDGRHLKWNSTPSTGIYYWGGNEEQDIQGYNSYTYTYAGQRFIVDNNNKTKTQNTTNQTLQQKVLKLQEILMVLHEWFALQKKFQHLVG